MTVLLSSRRNDFISLAASAVDVKLLKGLLWELESHEPSVLLIGKRMLNTNLRVGLEAFPGGSQAMGGRREDHEDKLEGKTRSYPGLSFTPTDATALPRGSSRYRNWLKQRERAKLTVSNS